MANAELKAQDYETYLPIVETGPKPVLLFPNYVFVEFDRESQPWQRINNTRGVSRLLPVHAEIPHPIPNCFIPNLKVQLENELVASKTITGEVQLFAGDVVKVTSGPFQGHRATVSRVRKGWVIAALHLFGTAVDTSLRRHQVELFIRSANTLAA